MKQEELRTLVKQELIPFMARFEQDNRGNRISLEHIQGLGMILENFITEIIQKVLKVHAEKRQVEEKKAMEARLSINIAEAKSPDDITGEEVT